METGIGKLMAYFECLFFAVIGFCSVIFAIVTMIGIWDPGNQLVSWMLESSHRWQTSILFVSLAALSFLGLNEMSKRKK